MENRLAMARAGGEGMGELLAVQIKIVSLLLHMYVFF